MERRIKTDASNTIGANIHRIRREAGISQTEMAARVQLYGVAMTREGLVKIEGGRQHISLVQLKAIRELLGCSYSSLLDSPGE